MALSKKDRRLRIRYRLRKRISGSSEKLRLSVFRSNKNISVQVIDDIVGNTIVSASSLEKEIMEKKGISKSEQAGLVGKLIAKKAIEKGISSVIFDRSGYLYHGRVKKLADAAREGGLKF